MLIASFPAGPFQTNCYVVAEAAGAPCVIVDPGVGAADPVRRILAEHELTPAGIVLTHGHVDHIAAVEELCAELDLAVWIHPADRHLLSDPGAGLGPQVGAQLAAMAGRDTFAEPARVRELTGDALELGGFTIGLAHAPGHTAGCTLLRFPYADPANPAITEVICTGDVLFERSVGRTDLAGGDPTTMARTLREVVLTLPDSAAVLPGHGRQTSIGAERTHNPYLQPAALPVPAGDPNAKEER